MFTLPLLNYKLYFMEVTMLKERKKRIAEKYNISIIAVDWIADIAAKIFNTTPVQVLIQEDEADDNHFKMFNDTFTDIQQLCRLLNG